MHKHFGIFSGITFFSRILGFIRDMLIANKLGASIFSDIFFVSFRLPNLFRAIFAEGALAGTFLPIYKKIESINGKKDALKFAHMVQIILLASLAIVIILTELFMGGILSIFAPKFLQMQERDLFLTVARCLFPYIILVSLASFYSCILQSEKKFAPGAICPAILNIFLIFALLLDFSTQKMTLYLMCAAIIAAGCAQVLYLLQVLKTNKLLPIQTKFKISKNLKQFIQRFCLCVLGAEIYQVNVFVDTFFASAILYGVSYLYYADRIMQLPLALIGIALNSVALPLISCAMAQNNTKDVVKIQNKALKIAIILGVPATTGLILLAENIIVSLFMTGQKFNYTAAIETANALKVYSFALPAHILNRIFITAFFAKGDAKTPFVFAIVGLLINLLLNFILVKKYQHIGIAAASVVAAWVNFILLIYKLKSLKLFILAEHIKTTLVRVFFATSFMIFALEMFCAFTESGFLSFDTHLMRICSLIFLCILGILCYFIVFYLSKFIDKKGTTQKF